MGFNDKMIDIDKLEMLAKGATQGEWYTGIGWEQMEPGKFICARDGGGVVLVDDEDEKALSDADHEYIAAANPATILELIAEVRRLRAALAEVAA